MNTNGASTRMAGTPLFDYERTVLNGFGLAEEPDERVVQAIRKLTSLLAKGFYDQPTRESGALKALYEKKAELEDEQLNGINAAVKNVKLKIRAVRAAEIALNEAIQREKQAAEQVQKLLRALQQARRKKGQGQHADEASDYAASTAQTGDAATRSQAGIDPVKVLEGQLAEAEKDKKKAEEHRLKAKNDLDSREAERQEASVEHRHIKDTVMADLGEVLRQIAASEQELSTARNYGDQFSLEKLDGRVGGKTPFLDKIGSDHTLNSLFISVEEKVKRSRLSFNAALLLREELVLAFLFLRTYYRDGLRDAKAIYDRVVDESEGGVKYLYDYVIEDVVKRIIDAKKLIK